MLLLDIKDVRDKFGPGTTRHLALIECINEKEMTVPKAPETSSFDGRLLSRS